MSDLRERVPGHSLIDELLHQWDLGTIHIDPRSNGVVIDEQAEGWYRGVIGERRVAEILSSVGDDWTVLHSVPVGAGASDIDHVAIGPAGVFTINTKFSPGKDVWVAGRGMYVGGSKQPYTLNAIHEARRASTYLTGKSGLTIPVTGLIVFVDPGRMTFKAPAGGGELDPEIHVLRQDELVAALSGRREFNDAQVAAIVDAAIRPETWSQVVAPSSTGRHIVREFQALEEAVGPRLSLPRGQASTATRAARPVPQQFPIRTARPSRQPSSATSTRRRKPKRSRLEKLYGEVALPVAGLIIVWIWYSTTIAK
jgi:hypothetical protein